MCKATEFRATWSPKLCQVQYATLFWPCSDLSIQGPLLLSSFGNLTARRNTYCIRRYLISRLSLGVNIWSHGCQPCHPHKTNILQHRHKTRFWGGEIWAQSLRPTERLRVHQASCRKASTSGPLPIVALSLAIALKYALCCTPSWRIRLKARVDLGDQTTEFMPFEVICTAILTYFYLF